MMYRLYDHIELECHIRCTCLISIDVLSQIVNLKCFWKRNKQTNKKKTNHFTSRQGHKRNIFLMGKVIFSDIFPHLEMLFPILEDSKQILVVWKSETQKAKKKKKKKKKGEGPPPAIKKRKRKRSPPPAITPLLPGSKCTLTVKRSYMYIHCKIIKSWGDLQNHMIFSTRVSQN